MSVNSYSIYCAPGDYFLFYSVFVQADEKRTAGRTENNQVEGSWSSLHTFNDISTCFFSNWSSTERFKLEVVLRRETLFLFQDLMEIWFFLYGNLVFNENNINSINSILNPFI